jgi:heat-inducible transcriptional repressor
MANTSVDYAVNERAQYFLKVLIEHYIRDGQPVGSRTLARDSGMNLSPATIRNVMSDLEEAGLITSPHTSAGRVPTVSGYRFFVDFLVSLRPLEKSEVQQMQQQIAAGADGKALATRASAALSNLTRMAGLVMIPRREQILFRQIEFVQLSGSRILVILVTSDGEVQNRVIESAIRFSESQLTQAQNFLTANYGGQDLQSMRAGLLKEMQSTRKQMDEVMTQAIELAGLVLNNNDDPDGDFVLSGQTNLMGFHDLSDMTMLKHLFDSFAEKRQILHLLDHCMDAEGVQVFIGEESDYEPFDNCTLVTAPYETDGSVAGVLGVIGPTRMDYNKVIPIVDVTAKLLSMALKTQK